MKKSPIQKLIDLHAEMGLQWLKDSIKTIELLSNPKAEMPKFVKLPPKEEAK